MLWVQLLMILCGSSVKRNNRVDFSPPVSGNPIHYPKRADRVERLCEWIGSFGEEVGWEIKWQSSQLIMRPAVVQETNVEKWIVCLGVMKSIKALKTASFTKGHEVLNKRLENLSHAYFFWQQFELKGL